MSNHVHLIATPTRAESMLLALKHTHERYAGYFNARHASSGHVWQGRFYSCPLDPPHLWTALRYAELNPVRAGMVAEADQCPWSSAAAHCAGGRLDAGLEMDPWQGAWGAARWREYLHAAGAGADAEAIRRSTHTGRPLGAAISWRIWNGRCGGLWRRKKGAAVPIRGRTKGSGPWRSTRFELWLRGSRG